MLANLAGGGLLTILAFAALGAIGGLIVPGGRRGAILGAVVTSLAVTVALFPAPTFRAQLGESAVAIFWIAIFLTPFLLYATLIRRLRRRVAEPDIAPEPGLRLIEDDAALHADRLEMLKAENARQRGFWRDRFSLIWRAEDGAVAGSIGVRIVLGLAEIEVLIVDEAHRGTGIGTDLLRGAEDEARRRGARHAILHTFSWQAPDFYARHGWQEVRRIRLPGGAERIEFEKML